MKSPPSERPTRRLLHTRQVVCTGYERSDGLYEIEGRLTDSKADDSDMAFKYIRAGEPIHQMHLTLVIDLDLIIHGVEASTEAGPTPYCHEINAAYEQLVGIKIGAGFKKRVIQKVGGVLGCTHLTELLGPMATTAYQTTFFLKHKAEQQKHDDNPGYLVPRPWVIDTCHAYRSEGDAVRLIWPQTPPPPEAR